MGPLKTARAVVKARSMSLLMHWVHGNEPKSACPKIVGEELYCWSHQRNSAAVLQPLGNGCSTGK